MSENTTDNTLVLTTDDTTANALVQTIRAAVNGSGKYAAYVEAHTVTRENIKDHARALAVLAYPNDKPVQKIDGQRTRFGNAVQAAGYGLRAALGDEETADKPITLRASLSGEGGGTVTIPADHALYAVLVNMIQGDSADETAENAA